MRSDWIPLSASAETLNVVSEQSARWLAMAVMYAFASIALTLGLPAVLTLFDRRGRRLGLAGAAVFLVGAVGTCGYAMLMVFFRALVEARALRPGALDSVTDDRTLTAFIDTWVSCFYGGALLIAVGLFVAGSTPRWVPALLVAFVLLLPVSSHLGRVGSAVQVMAFAAACTGIAMAAVATAPRARVEQLVG